MRNNFVSCAFNHPFHLTVSSSSYLKTTKNGWLLGVGETIYILFASICLIFPPAANSPLALIFRITFNSIDEFQFNWIVNTLAGSMSLLSSSEILILNLWDKAERKETFIYEWEGHRCVSPRYEPMYITYYQVERTRKSFFL